MNKKTFNVKIVNDKGETIFDLVDVEAPDFWSQRAVDITASKFFRSSESSVFTLVDRVVGKVYEEGFARGYPIKREWSEKLYQLCLEQRGSFNSPVWFNIGVPGRAQRASGCFILSVKDDMESILALQRAEATIFKFGGGVGSNLSPLRSSFEYISDTGSKSSGPMGFAHAFDTWAGVVKSGSKARRAAKMVVLNVDHPDLPKFIDAKPLGERITQALIAAGFKNDFTSDEGAQHWAPFQNANYSVRVPDSFMYAVQEGRTISSPYVTGAPVSGSVYAWEMNARQILRKIAEAAWRCGDPGLQFDDTINAWNCVPAMGRINATNPCGEFCFPDDSACNLASLNLLLFRKPDGSINYEALGEAIDVFITAMDILCDFADYPTDAIKYNSLYYRPLGLGYANLGALLMANGLPYDSDEARMLAAEITSFMTARAYLRSVELAKKLGPYKGWPANRGAHLNVLRKHASAARQKDLASMHLWSMVVAQAEEHGLRNAQVTLLAPTGTIGFMMDCDSFGIEPLDAIAKTKKLVGGGRMTIVANVVEQALKHLGYDSDEGHLDARGVFERLKSGKSFEAAGIAEEHWPIFATSYGELPISPMGHLKMMAAVQPFLSGAISKTVALPKSSTVEDVEKTYIDAWKMGIKCIAVYVDGSKASQPIEPVREKGGTIGDVVLPEHVRVQPTGVREAMKATLDGIRREHSQPQDHTDLTYRCQHIGGKHHCQAFDVGRCQLCPFWDRLGWLATLLVEHPKYLKDNPERREIVKYLSDGGWTRPIPAPVGEVKKIDPRAGTKCQESALGDGDGAAVKYPCSGTIGANGVCDRASEHWPFGREDCETRTSVIPAATIRATGFAVKGDPEPDRRSAESFVRSVTSPHPYGGTGDWCSICQKGRSNPLHIRDSLNTERAAYLNWAASPDRIQPPVRHSYAGDGGPCESCNRPQKQVREAVSIQNTSTPHRRRLPDERQALTHKFSIGGHEGYMTVGLYEDGQPGEIFVKMAKEGGTVSGFVDAFATSISMLLQCGVPVAQLAEKFKGGRFEPEGWTKNEQIRRASSVLDYIFRWLELKFVEQKVAEVTEKIKKAGISIDIESIRPSVGTNVPTAHPADIATQIFTGGVTLDDVAGGFPDLSTPPCTSCGGSTRKAGACFTCENCGTPSGGCQ